MRIVILVLALLAITAAVLFGPALLRKGDDVDPVGDRSPGASGTTPELQGTPPAPTPDPDLPKQEPEPERFRLERPLKVLALMTSPAQRWVRVIEASLAGDSNMVLSGYAVRAQPGAPAIGRGEAPPAGAAPTAAWFDAQGFDVLAVCDVDPGLFEPAFWEAVAARVRAQSLGLWVQPGVPQPGADGTTPDVHPMLRHPVLSTLLPIAKAKAVRGDPTPGIYGKGAVFHATNEGEKHPASRIVHWPEWSRRVWQMGALATPPWSTQFCYPVETVSPGSLVLVEAHPPTGAPIPMYVQGPPAQGRVLWFGAQQIHDDTLRDGRQTGKWYAMTHNAFVWLAGRAP